MNERVVSIEYDGDLMITFSDGLMKAYCKVPRSEYERLVSSEQPETMLHLLRHYPCKVSQAKQLTF